MKHNLTDQQIRIMHGLGKHGKTSRAKLTQRHNTSMRMPQLQAAVKGLIELGLVTISHELTLGASRKTTYYLLSRFGVRWLDRRRKAESK